MLSLPCPTVLKQLERRTHLVRSRYVRAGRYTKVSEHTHYNILIKLEIVTQMFPISGSLQNNNIVTLPKKPNSAMQSPLKLANTWFAGEESQAVKSPPATPSTIRSSSDVCASDPNNSTTSSLEVENAERGQNPNDPTDFQDIVDRLTAWESDQQSAKEALQQKGHVTEELLRIARNKHRRDVDELERTIEALEERAKLRKSNDYLRVSKWDLKIRREGLYDRYKEALVELEASEEECRRLRDETFPRQKRQDNLILLANKQFEMTEASSKEARAYAERMEGENERLVAEEKAMSATIVGLREEITEVRAKTLGAVFLLLLLLVCVRDLTMS